MLSAAELAAMRATAELTLIDRAQVKRPTLASDGRLGQATTWTLIASAVPCRIAELGEGRGQRAVEVGARMVSQGTSTVRFPVGTPLAEGDQLTIGAHTLVVERVIVTSYATLLSAVCKEDR